MPQRPPSSTTTPPSSGIFAWFEQRLHPTAKAPPSHPPPNRLLGFYWYHVRQAKGLVLTMFLAAFIGAGLDTLVPVFIGRLVNLVTTLPPTEFWAGATRPMLLMAAVMLLGKPITTVLHYLSMNQALNPSLTNLVRWQNHWHVVRQGWSFFQNDFAGRIANRVTTVGPSLRESVSQAIYALLYVVVFGSSALSVLAAVDPRLAVPLLVWIVVYGLLLRHFVPRTRARSKRVSEARSTLSGKIVDAYSNILTVKLFARARDEDQWVRDSIDDHTDAQRAQLRMITAIALWLMVINTLLMVAVGGTAAWLYSAGRIEVGAVAMALPLTWQICNISGWVAQNVTSILENIGSVQDGMRSIAVERQNPDVPGAGELVVTQGAISFQHITFGYGRTAGVLHDVDLDIAPGERIGLLGHSGAGKSTLVHLLLGFFRTEQGRILIDGQDIGQMTQESLRQQIGMVTQETILFNDTVANNIAYGNRHAPRSAVIAAAKRSYADQFISNLPSGYDTVIGERGIGLSGGQRQRIALARAMLRDPAILILDEATSAVDIQDEALIRKAIEEFAVGRTTFLITHSLGTLQFADRIVLMNAGKIDSIGTETELRRNSKLYQRLHEIHFHRESA